MSTDNEHVVRRALQLAGMKYYEHLSSILEDARKLQLIDTRHNSINLSLDHWHVPYQEEKLIQHYGYYCNGMMNRAFSGIHPMTAYYLTNKCFILITLPSAKDNPADISALDGLSLCKNKLGIVFRSIRADRGESSIEFAQRISEAQGVTYCSDVNANSILREHVREEAGSRMARDSKLADHFFLRNIFSISD